MKILVTIKRVVDHAVKVRVKAETSRINLSNVKMVINPFCEIAIEQAIRLKEAKMATEVIVLSIGKKDCQEQLRYCMALGADRSILIETDQNTDVDVSPLQIAKTIKKIVEIEKPDLVLMGKQSIDGDNGQTGSLLAGLLNWSEASCISSLSMKDSSNSCQVEEETEEGRRALQVPLPAVLTTDLRLNTPRYPKLPNIVKAKKKPLNVIALNTLVEREDRIKVLRLEEPKQRKAGMICKDIDELIAKLKIKGVL